jgi:hypothetical protein
MKRSGVALHPMTLTASSRLRVCRSYGDRRRGLLASASRLRLNKFEEVGEAISDAATQLAIEGTAALLPPCAQGLDFDAEIRGGKPLIA